MLGAINIAETMYSKKQIQLAATFMEAVYDQILTEAVKVRGYDIGQLDEKVQYNCIKIIEANLQLRKDFRSYRSLSSDIARLKKQPYPPEDKFFEICDELHQTQSHLWRLSPFNSKTVLRGAINNFLDNVRNPMNHGDGSKEANTDSFVKDFIEALCELYAQIAQK